MCWTSFVVLVLKILRNMENVFWRGRGIWLNGKNFVILRADYIQ